MWICNECNEECYTGSVSQDDLEKLQCSGCGADEFHWTNDKEDKGLPIIPSEKLEPHFQKLMVEMLEAMAYKQITFEQMEATMRYLMHFADNAGAIHAEMATTQHWANMANYPEQERKEFVQNMVKSYEKSRGIDLSEIWGDEHWSVTED